MAVLAGGALLILLLVRGRQRRCLEPQGRCRNRPRLPRLTTLSRRWEWACLASASID